MGDDTSCKKNTSSPKSKSNCFKIYNVLNKKKENQTRDNLCLCMKMNTCLDDHYKYNNLSNQMQDVNKKIDFLVQNEKKSEEKKYKRSIIITIRNRKKRNHKQK